MPSLIELHLTHPDWMEVSPSKLHGLGYRVFRDLLTESPPVRTEDPSESPRRSPTSPGRVGEPFTVWPLRADESALVGESGSGRSMLRLNWLRDDGTDLRARVSAEPVSFGSVRCRVTEVGARSVTFAQLVGVPPARQLEFRFHTPTLFSHRGKAWAVPDPELILGSLLRRWNAYSELQIAESDQFDLIRVVELDDLQVQTAAGWARGPGETSGFVGTVLLRLSKSAGISTSKVFGALGAAAEFLGVGKQTTYGYGVVTAQRTA